MDACKIFYQLLQVQELKVLGNRLLKEMKQKIINGYNGASSDLSTSELTAPSSA